MKRLLVGLLLLAISAAVLASLLYLLYARDLPDLSTPEAVRAALALRIESERVSATPVGARYPDSRFEVLPSDRLARGLVTGLLAREGCPEYLVSPKEEGWPRIRRTLSRLRSTSGGPPGPGRCQLRFADRIAESIGAVDPFHATIAVHHLLSSLSIEELLTYRLAATYYGRGVIGVRDASQALFKKDPNRLDLAQCAELLLAESQYPSFEICKDPNRLKLLRDGILDRMASANAISDTEARRAKTRPLHCTTRR